MTREEAISNFRARWSDFLAAEARADAAFKRWFDKRQRGERTNAAAAQRLSNLANYASADLSTAAGKLYLMDIDPTEIVPEYTEA